MAALPAIIAIGTGALLSPGETIDRADTFMLHGGTGYRYETHVGDTWGLTYIGQNIGAGNVFMSYNDIPGGFMAGAGYRMEFALSDGFSWSAGLSLNHYEGGVNLGAYTLAGVHASLIYHLGEKTAIGLGFDHYSHAYILGDKNPGWNQITLQLYRSF